MNRKTTNMQYTFKVSLKGNRRIWRTLVLCGDRTLDDLHEAIYKSFDRYDEHLYSFYFPKAATGRERIPFQEKEYTSPITFEEPDLFSDKKTFNAAETELCSLHLSLGQTFEYLFDFGDMWWHELKVMAVEPATSKSQLPTVVERHGDSPPQYPRNDE